MVWINSADTSPRSPSLLLWIQEDLKFRLSRGKLCTAALHLAYGLLHMQEIHGLLPDHMRHS